MIKRRSCVGARIGFMLDTSKLGPPEDLEKYPDDRGWPEAVAIRE